MHAVLATVPVDTDSCRGRARVQLHGVICFCPLQIFTSVLLYHLHHADVAQIRQGL